MALRPAGEATDLSLYGSRCVDGYVSSCGRGGTGGGRPSRAVRKPIPPRPAADAGQRGGAVETARAGAAATAPRAVQVEPVRQEDVHRAIEVVGTLAAQDEVTISSQTEGAVGTIGPTLATASARATCSSSSIARSRNTTSTSRKPRSPARWPSTARRTRRTCRRSSRRRTCRRRRPSSCRPSRRTSAPRSCTNASSCPSRRSTMPKRRCTPSRRATTRRCRARRTCARTSTRRTR